MEEQTEITEQITEESRFKDLPGYKNITCRKCGTVYSKALKECPSCRFSPVRQLIKIIAFSMLTAMIIASIVFLAVRVGRLEKSVEELTEKIGGIDTSTGYDITELSYYQEQLIYEGANLTAFGDCLIYAMQEDCSACEEANEYIYMYLYYGYPDYLPVYFVTPDSAEDIFFEVLGCENTPTLYRLKDGEVTEKAVGVDDVYTMLDKVIEEAGSEGQ